MPVISTTNHAFFFDGVTDSIIIPQGNSSTDNTSRGLFNSNPNSGSDNILSLTDEITIEAWVVPDCGGVIVEKENCFSLSLGNVDTPGPAVFNLNLLDTEKNEIETIQLTTAYLTSNGYDGTIFPPSTFTGIHDSYNRFNSSYDDATTLNINHRPLMHVIATFNSKKVQLYINGILMAEQTLYNDKFILLKNNNPIFVGGKGGKFRGIMEAIHLCTSFTNDMVQGEVPTVKDDTLLLFRFEEPIAPIESVYPLNLSASADSTTIYLSTTNAASLATELTGSSQTSGTIDFTISPYSSGNYTITQSTKTATTSHSVPHVPYNLLLNPNGINLDTLKPSQKPPERVRLESINIDTGALTISSIHLDFATNSNGKRGLLHAYSELDKPKFIVLGADLLIDSGTSRPYQPPHFSSQAIDRTGQMVIDESDLENHGFVFSSNMATTVNDTDNPFAALWPTTLDEGYQIGHSGRHIKNHVKGHTFLRMLPRAEREIIDLKGGGQVDLVDVVYDNTREGIKDQIPVNSEVDVYRDAGTYDIKNVINSSTVTAVYNDFQDVTVSDGKEKLIALGGTTFDYRPFMLKGQVPTYGTTPDANTRKHHLRPSKESRVALLHIPLLRSTYNHAPFIEVHYNAIDLTGASMNSYDGSTRVNTAQPLLMVEKTVPASNTAFVNGDTTAYLYDIIVSQISSLGSLTLYSPGGYVEFDSLESDNVFAVNELVGDNSEGYDADDDLDESYTPANFTPYAQGLVGNSPPKIVLESSSQNESHPSIFNKVYFPKIETSKNLTTSSNITRIEPEVNVGSPSDGQFDTGVSGVSSSIHEFFDVIDNIMDVDNPSVADMALIIQPCDRTRTNQLAHIKHALDDSNDVNQMSLLYLLNRAVIRGIKETNDEDGSFTIIECEGIFTPFVSQSIDFKGKGSPDSHIVKEIEPNAPVVTVTLGGPGQGAVDTKPTYDESKLSRLPFSSRRSYSVRADYLNTTSGGSITVSPLNNHSNDMKSWGTYGFPKVGYVYFEDGSKARYQSKSGNTFTFQSGAADIGSGYYVAHDGTEFTFIKRLLRYIGYISNSDSTILQINRTLYSEPDFGDESLIDNGSTVNDRMFQKMNGVNHDYQLGTQFASTRALAEIPFFDNQFFGKHVGPNNSFKIHLDATMTAHSYNPSPVGKRPIDLPPADREVESAYSFGDNNPFTSTVIESLSGNNLVVKDINIFPTPEVAVSYQQITNDTTSRYRKVFLPSGDWAFYSAITENTKTLTLVYPSANFRQNAIAGTPVTVGGPNTNDGAIVLASDSFTPSSEYEDRSNTYYDSASVKTQGGNVDYGMRQYVSAVEFKEGPETNPHAEKIQTKRASAVIGSVNVIGTTATRGSILEITLSDEDMELFPDIGIDNLSDLVTGTGETFYEVQCVHPSSKKLLKFHYYGTLNKYNNFDITVGNSGFTVQGDNTSIILYYYEGFTTAQALAGNNTYPDFSVLAGEKMTLVGKRRRVFYDNFVSTKSSITKNIASNVHEKMGIFNELVANVKIDTNIAITAYSTTNKTVTVNPVDDVGLFDLSGLNVRKGDVLFAYKTSSTEERYATIGTVDSIAVHSDSSVVITLSDSDLKAIANVTDYKLGVGCDDFDDVDAILNKTWVNPYASGGLRNGDTIWGNMSYNNPHATEGLFFKSRGVLNEAQVWTGFNNGEGNLNSNPRDSIPLENFLIGNTCLETARNFAQHVNKTIEENYKSLGLTAAEAPTVAYVDPYLSNEGHARVLLYDVAHDREFIAFQDLHMQVQSELQTTHIGWNRYVVKDTDTTRTDLHSYLASYNGSSPSAWTTQIDVTNGYPSQNRFIRSTQQSKFIESAYAHDLPNKQAYNLTSNYISSTNTTPKYNRYSRLYGKGHGHFVHTEYSLQGASSGYTFSNSLPPQTTSHVSISKIADDYHKLSRRKGNDFISQLIKIRNATTACSFRDPSTFFDTPDGTRVIPAFLSLKGIRSETLSLDNHEESRLQHLPQWKDMGFVRRLSIDAGSIGLKTRNSLEAAEEIVRTINQYAALNARLSDGSSAHDPSPFWDTKQSFSSAQKGTHMGYLRAHIGRAVTDRNGVNGWTVVIHSTVPGASGRNFCVWLDNSQGQTEYQPEFIIGHGGRWRNFWALPEDIQGENMHPAPMPLNKHGRPFAPITTLQQYLEDENEENVIAVTDYGTDEEHTIQSVSDVISGQMHNTSIPKSFESEGSPSTLIQGLRTGKSAIARVNFGGLVATGVPGFTDVAGKWGYGTFSTEDKARYGNNVASSYSSHVSNAEKIKLAKGESKRDLYGFRFEDHLGNNYGVRFIYRERENTRGGRESFVKKTEDLPSTISQEICVFFNDKDVSQGGFTIGKNMSGSGDATGMLDTGDATNPVIETWTGNLWNAVNAPEATVRVNVTENTSESKLQIVGLEPFDASFTTDGKLNYLGFPKNGGLLQISDIDGTGNANVGKVFHYTHQDGSYFYGITPSVADWNITNDPYIISPVLNRTTLVTDELMAAVTAAAINATSPTTFDCTHMYTTDGKTFGEWGVKPDSIVITPFSNDGKYLSESFSASVHPDLGIQAAHLEFGEQKSISIDLNVDDDNLEGVISIATPNHIVTDAKLDLGKKVDCGYIPRTLLQIVTKSKGRHTNTPTPVFVNSTNNPVDTTAWKNNLNGVTFTRSSGDHILPKIDSPQFRFDSNSSWGSQRLDGVTNAELWNFLIPSDSSTASGMKAFGEKKRAYFVDDSAPFLVCSMIVQSQQGADSEKKLIFNTNTGINLPSSAPGNSQILTLFGDERAREFAGLRTLGSVFSEPITFFKGGKSSPDHSVPVFFGGGFTGVTLDVNDGTTNDYSSFYTHPYASGPTGTAGIQNANEISTSFAMLDCNAMFAFFPGTPLCNQHRGSLMPPFFNQDNMLTPDLDRGGTSYTRGVVKAKPIPLVMRFAHPTARYEDHRDGTDNKTTYMIFGPGQAFPFTGVHDSTGTENVNEPFSGRIITSGNTWSRVPRFTGNKQAFPNHITNTDGDYLPEDITYYNANTAYHWKAIVNWETPAGHPRRTMYQRPAHGRHYGQIYTITDGSSTGSQVNGVMPLRHTPAVGFGITMGADTVFHMDGGLHAGGSWLDNQLTFNPVHPKKNTRIVGGNSSTTWTRDNQIHPTAFRVAGPLTGRILDYSGSETVSSSDSKLEYIVVDATRCQNGEELATVLGAAINAFPGAGALKSLGGTHMPSMGNAMRQDRYGWVDTGAIGTYDTTNKFVESATTTNRDLLENLPASGWLKSAIDTVDNANSNTQSACYHAKEILVVDAAAGTFKARFRLAQHKKAAANGAFDVNTSPDGNLFVWSKAGTIRFNNEDDSTRDHMTQVHFSGIVDAVDRTKPIGAVGWAGERYSYLNSLKVGTEGYGAGLGAHHSMLSFAPYGTASTMITTLSQLPHTYPLFDTPESVPPIDGVVADLDNYLDSFYSGGFKIAGASTRSYSLIQTDSATTHHNYSNTPINFNKTNGQTSSSEILPDTLSQPVGLYGSAFLVVSYESESALIAKYDRDGITATGDWLQIHGVSSDAITYAGTTLWDERFHGQDRFIAPANAGPNVEALIVHDMVVPKSTAFESDVTWVDTLFPTGATKHMHGSVSSDLELENATPDRAKTGDLIYDLDYSAGSYNLEPETAGPVESITVSATGSGYSTGFAATTGGNGSGCRVNVVSVSTGALNSVTLASAGTGYEVGDVLTVAGGSGGTVTVGRINNLVERNVASHHHTTSYQANKSATYWMGDVNAYQIYENSAIKNFNTENVVWKRMDGGNLSLPAINARGLGAVPFMTRVASNTAYTTGEKIFGNVRFSFETTNSAMLPILQAQELSHPQLAARYPLKVENVLQIPNEEIQFDSINVLDDSGQVHKIEGGSPFGTIIRGYRLIEDRTTKGTAPSLANSGKPSNLKITLPNPDSIPGNIVVRSGFDPIQAYQNETFGSGGMLHADLGVSAPSSDNKLERFFDNTVKGPRQAPNYENHNWEHIDPLTYKSTLDGWKNESLQTSYELHDKTLFFHVTKMGHSHTHRYPTVYTHTSGIETDTVSVSSWNATTNALVIDATLNTNVFNAGFGTKEVKDSRKFLRVYNPTTDEGVVCSYTSQGSTTLTVVGDVDFATFMAGQTVTDLKVVPSYYVPAGSARFFAARRMRDHAEVSGSSPDMAHTQYTGNETVAYNRYSKPVLTPMPYPRMGHHFVTPTMPMLPGHWSHPAYQSLYKKHRAQQRLQKKFLDSATIQDVYDTEEKKTNTTLVEDFINPLESEINFSGINAAPSGPSDIHGGAFTLMFETAIKYDGYGVLASTGLGGDINKVGGHTVVLEAAAYYTLGYHFPDPAEVGAYQIIIQPNLHVNQIRGYSANTQSVGKGMTYQQVNTVVGIADHSSQTGAISLILEKATDADVRGCEIFINETMLDVSPDYGSQFTNIPPLLLYNPFGVNLNETPSFTRQGFPYSPMFSDATPAYTLNIPWWTILFDNIDYNSSNYITDLDDYSNYIGISQYAPHNYYQFSKSTYGSIGNQLTIQGYPSIYPNIYSRTLQNISLIPQCTVISFSQGDGTITVDDASVLPRTPLFGQKLIYQAENGATYIREYIRRSGDARDEINLPNTIHLNVNNDAFWDNLFAGAVISLTTTGSLNDPYTHLIDKKKNVFAHFLPDLINGSQDTTSLHLPDAFLCKSHPNLGRPYTYFSDDDSRAWNGNAVDAAMYNSLPEHFETFHYFAASYSMSYGPFYMDIKSPNTTKDGSVTYNSDNTDVGDDGGNITYHRLWPCGSRGGPQASSLDEYMIAVLSWHYPGEHGSLDFNISDKGYDSSSSGSYTDSSTKGLRLGWEGGTGARSSTERRSYGYRIALRQALNKPRWGIHSLRYFSEIASGSSASGNAVLTTDYHSGPLVQEFKYGVMNDAPTWIYGGGGSDTSNVGALGQTYVGVMETATNFTGMLGIDKPENLVRYSDGRRMTRPYGAPVRTIRNPAGTRRDWWGDGEGKGIERLSKASEYYLIDWWANERGEDVRRAPVRGFGIRPAWDCGDAYEYDRTNNRSPYDRVWNNGKPIFNMKGIVNLSTGAVSISSGYTIPRFGGTDNDANLNGNDNDLVDVFAPTHAMRIGDMGNGRGVRYPTHFNEDILTALSAPVEKTGMVLSTHTAEPLFGKGLLRPRNAVLQADELPRGISDTLDISDDGLLKPEATVSPRTEKIVGTSVHVDAISRSSPRIGVDGDILSGVETNHIVINTEAHSLHTDRNIGQRIVLEGALQPDIGNGNTLSLTDLNLTTISFARQSRGAPINSALRFTHTQPFRPYGGVYIMESKVHAGLFDDTGWGRNNLAGVEKTTNPYQNSTLKLNTKRNNQNDKSVKFMLKSIKLLDNKHIQLFRLNNDLHSSSPQYALNYLYSTSAGKYGLFNYEVPTTSANTPYATGIVPNTNGPYHPVFLFDSTGSNFEIPDCFGPKLLGSSVSGFDNTSLSEAVTRLVISENTLQHHRSDAARRRQELDTDDAVTGLDFTVKPRFSQSLHPKGHKGDVTFGTSDHSGDGA